MAYDPAADLDALLSLRSTLIAAMAACAGKPDYSIDGQQVTYSSLFDRLEKVNSQIAAIQGPIEQISEGFC